MKLNKSDSILFLFKDSEGKEIDSKIGVDTVMELVGDEAFDSLPRVECTESTCKVNGFCECNDEFFNFELDSIIIKTDRQITEKELKIAAKEVNLQRGIMELLINRVRKNQSK